MDLNNSFPKSPASAGAEKLQDLPVWRLDDLYSGLDSPEFAADLAETARKCRDFAQNYRGKLAGLLAEGGAGLFDAIRVYEQIDDLITRIMSYAGLVYAENTLDPVRAKFYGDAQEKITTASTDLLFFQLELNRLDDAALTAALAQKPLDHYRPWIEDLRREKPYQLEDRIEQLFHEKSVTGHAAWNRLFDETIAGLRFLVDGKDLTLEPALNLLQDRDPALREAAAKAIGATLKEKLGLFTLISNVLAKDKAISDQWRGFVDVADSRHLSNRVEGEVVDAMVSAVRAAYPRLSHRYYTLKARWFGKDRLMYWDRNAPLPDAPLTSYSWTQARDAVLTAYAGFSPDMSAIARDSSMAPGSTRPSGPARLPAPSPIRPARASTPMCCSTTRASRAM